MSILKNDLVDNYFKVSNYIFKYKLSAGSFQLYSYLLYFFNKYGYAICVSNYILKEELNIKSNHTIAKYWKELIDKKLVIRNKTKTGFIYIFVGDYYE
jgi:hypothetical protein